MEIPAQGTSHAQRVLSLLNQQRGLGHFCDAMLSTVSGKVHLAHRNVLACFSHLFQDSVSDTPCIQINLPLECPDDGLELLLNFFYTGELHLDDSNLEKIQNAASGLSVPESLLHCQSLSCVETVQSPVSSEDDTAKQLFPLISADPQPDHIPKGKTRSCLRTKNKPDAFRIGSVVTASDDDPPASTLTTTTRSGRRVKGPNRLVGESPMSTVTRQGAGRRKPSSLEDKEQETAATEDGDHLRDQDMSETEQVERSVDNQNDDDVDNEDDDDSDRGGSMDILNEGTDEEYVPHDSPCSTSKTPQAQCKRHKRSTNKENGKGTSKDSKKGSVQCPTCHETFLSKYYLKVPTVINLIDRASMQSFVFPSILLSARRHTGEKPFECAKCGKCYYRKENLLEHEARNCLIRAEMVFSCSKCTLTFKKRHELRLHTVTHTGEMPNKCTSCPEQFMQKKDLRIHMIKVHGAPKPHACSLCPKCFLSRTELRLHEAAKHRGEKLFVCEECGHRASSRNGLQMHIKAIHRKLISTCTFEHILERNLSSATSVARHFAHKAHLRRHSQIHNRVENYNPKLRRLRNLVVKDESAAASSSPPSQAEAQAGPADMVDLVNQPEVVVVKQVVSASAGGTGGEQATYSMTDGAVSGEQTGTALTGRTDGGVEQTPFTVADVTEQTLLVTDAYPIHQSSVVVELPSYGAGGKV
ncbi:hypothetical protein cypCar_00046734 [Cyprinus carpio]|nr:hypothetical protein cypCar_00046734 [Cyprinus carpio]